MTHWLSLSQILLRCSLLSALLLNIGCDRVPVMSSGLSAMEVVKERGPLKVSATEPMPVSSLVKRHVVFGRLVAANADVLGFARAGRIASLPTIGGDFQAGEIIAELANDELVAQRDTLAQQLQGNQDPTQAPALGRQLAELNRQIAAGQITAPFDGVVARSFSSVGDIAQERRPIIQLYQRGRPTVLADVTVSTAKQLSETDTQLCRFPERDISCFVQSISDSADVTGTVEALFSLDSDMDGVDWSYDQTIELRLSESRAANGFRVPAASLLSSASTPWSVLRIDSTPGGSRVTPVAVELIERQGDICLVSGELSGTAIVANGTHRVVAGQLVTPILLSREDIRVRSESSP